MYLSNKHLTSGEWFELPITAGRRTHNLNLRPGPLLQPSATLHPSDIPAGAAPRPGQCEPLRRKHRRSYLGRFARVAHLARSIAPRTAAGVLLALATLLTAPMPIQAAGNAQLEPCPAEAPVPTAVAVTAVPIVVESTTDEYFVLYVTFDVDGTELRFPVAVTPGAAGTTTLAENVEALPKERYRVEKYLIADPADVDGDCIDDITELNDLGALNPVNPAADVPLNDGAVAVPDTHTYDALAIGGYFKFALLGMDTDRPSVYFINANTHPTHQTFLDDRHINRQRVILGTIAYRQNRLAPDGSQGVYLYSLNTLPSRYSFSFSLMERTHTLLAASMPLLEDNLALYVRNRELPYIQSDLPLYRESRINLVFDGDVYSNIDFLALNLGVGVGRLQVLDPDGRPHPRDIVLYEALPNELPRVAGIISTVPQTPLSHVNLRAIQDGIPNAYIRDIRDDPAIAPLIGDFVRYEVTEDGYSIRAATKAEVDAHYEASRPAEEQTPEFDLSVTGIKPLSQIGFEDWKAFGVKAANVAVLGTLGFPEGTVPDGFAVPFYFYDEFMKAHDFYTRIETMLANEDFQTDFEVQDDRLDDLRDDIKDADSPQWIIDALTAMHATYPEGQSLRYRSSTNNEDLPGFNGAGLYDSKTQDPDETEEDGIDKSLKQVFASLWTFRAFTEREFHRIDHLAAKMGVLVHPNYSDELANGVAVSFDPIRGLDGYYYVNTQVGEDLVTNPEAHSIPEELLLRRDQGTYAVLSTSNLVEAGELLMSDAQLIQLRDHLTVIHDHFAGLYNPAPDDPFAMEIEFKITSENVLAIKQARPWVFSGASQTTPPPPIVVPPPPPVITPPDPDPPQPPNPGGGGGGGGGPLQTVPDAPTNLLVDVGDGQVTLTWKAPEDDSGSAITDYEYRIDQTGEWISIGSTDTTHTVTGLVNGTEYVFQVRAVNRNRKGRASNRVEATPRAAVTLLVANFMNGNNGAFNSRVYLWNPSASAGQVTVRVFTLPLTTGIARELTGPPLDLGTLEARSALNLKLVEDILIPLRIALPYTTDGGNLTLEFTIEAVDVRGVAQVFSSDFAFGTYPMQEIPSTSSESPTVLVANFTNGNNGALHSRVYLWNPSATDGRVTVRVFTLPNTGDSMRLQTVPLGILKAFSARNIRIAEDTLDFFSGIALPYTDDGGNLMLEFTIEAPDVKGAAQVFSSDFAFGTYPMQEIPSTSSESPTVLVANFMNGNNGALHSRVYLWNPSASAGEVTVRVFTLPQTGNSSLLGTLDLGSLQAESARNLKLAEDILAPLEIALPYVTDGGNLTLEFTIQAADARGVAQVFSSDFAFGTYPMQEIPSTSSGSPTVLVANFVNGNDAALNSRVYLWNPSLSAGSVTVRVFTLPLTAGVAQELTTAPLDLGTLGAESARNLKLAEDILTPLGIPTPYVTDGGNLTLEFTIQAADVRGTAQVFSSSFAFGTYPLQNVELITDGGDVPPTPLAPADEAAFNTLFVGKRAVTNYPTFYVDFVSPGRFRETEGSDIWTGSYTYRNTGSNTGTLTLNYDDGDRCTVSLTFDSTTAGTASYTCNDGSSGEYNWRLVAIPAPAGAPDLVVQTSSVDDSSPGTGALFTLSAMVSNAGTAESAATTLRYYQSADVTISSADTEVGTDSIEALAALGSSVQTVTLTAPSTAGSYYYGACVDAVAGESDTTDNCSASLKVDVVGMSTIPIGGICDRTTQVRDAIVDLIPGVHTCNAVTDADLAAITATLNLNGTGISSLRSGDFSGLGSLRSLLLAGNQLTALPADIFSGLVNVRTLRLHSNELDSLPGNLFDGLATVDILDLEFNNLTTLPSGLFAGLTLRFLGLEANQLRTLSAGMFESLGGSLTLDLSHNQLATLEDRVFASLDVEWLDLANNRLQTLPAGVFSGLTSLEALYLENNPGADFNFTMTIQRVPNTNRVVAVVPEGAPFDMTTTISATGGMLPAGLSEVTVPVGHTRSVEIAITPLDGTTISLGAAPAVTSSFDGIATAVGDPITF